MMTKNNEEYCIMEDNPPYWRNFRFEGSERHEVFEGYVTKNRQYSIEDGLVIFTTPEFHRTGKFSIHKSHKDWEEKTNMQKKAETIWLKYYNKTIDDFRKRYGKNYI